MLRFSKSKLGDYENCPRKYYLKNFTTIGQRRDEHEPDYLVDGKTCHTYFENYNLGLEGNALPNYNEFVARNIENFHDLLKQYGLDRALYAERKDYDPEIDLVTVIDAIYKKDDVDKKGNPIVKYILIDYKTGKFHSFKMTEMRFELYLYVYAAQKQLGIIIDEMGMFYTQFPENSFIEKVSQKRVASAMEKYHRYVANIQALKFPRKYNPLCKYCDMIYCCESYSDDIID